MESVGTSVWQWRPVRVLGSAALVVSLCVICRLVRDEDLAWMPWTLVVTAALLLVPIRWPYGALSVLIAASTMSRFSFDVSGWNAHAEHFAVFVVSLAAGAWLLGTGRRMQLEKLDYWILGYVAINYISSAFASVSPRDTLRWALLNNLAVLPYFLIRLLVSDLRTLQKVFRILLVVGVLESAYGILCFVSNHLFGTSTGMELGAYLFDVAAPYGSMYEPNLFGAYAGCCAVLAMAVYLIGERRLVYLICFLITSLATVLSFSRAALVGLLVAGGWVLWQARRTEGRRRNRTAILAAAVALILVIAGTATSSVLQERFGDLFKRGVQEETAITRFIAVQEALQDVPKHPLIGNGTASFQLLFDWAKYESSWSGRRAWLGSLIIRILHDCGLLGLATIFGFVISLWLKIRGHLSASGRQAPLLIALWAGALLYSISFQSTDGSILAFCWVHLGLLASAAILLSRQPPMRAA
jgi:O-antigen ligase